MKVMTEAFIMFVKHSTPLVNMLDAIYQIFTIKDTKTTIAFLLVVSYAIIHQETVMKLLPFAPLGIILFIFYNYYYQIEF
mmetsp:Transcript_17866/g.27634  ORF Transcript_17866/g.27634 Transcript_17866/m.27634 type:complete len:80 (-) Transcript_17866:1347-1586(-)